MRLLLVLTSVHPPDDPRIRYKLIPSLHDTWDAVYATAQPGPTNRQGLRWQPLRGPRLVRSLLGSWMLLRGHYDLASIHDPELLPAALVAAAMRRKIVFDLHEDLPAQLRSHRRLPRAIRPLASSAARILLRIAERTVTVSVAEEAYLRHFRGVHPVVPNLLESDDLPVAEADGDGIVYLGDVTAARGVEVLLSAMATLDTSMPLHLIGRCDPEFREHIEALAEVSKVDLRLHGYLPRPDALATAARCSVGVSPLLDLPNYRESLPTKVIEYLALGLPVVASDLPGTRRVIGGLPAVRLVGPGDAAALARGITAGLSEVDDARANAAAVRSRFRWPKEQVRSVYEAAARARPGEARP